MATFRYRFVRTMGDKVIGVAVLPPDGGLMLRIGQRDFDFDGRTAPKLESLDLYIETISEKPEFRRLEIHNVDRIREIDLDRFISLALFLKHVQAVADD